MVDHLCALWRVASHVTSLIIDSNRPRWPNFTPSYSCNRLALRCAVTLRCLYLLVTRWSKELVMFWLLLATSPSPVRSVASAGLAQAGRDELQNALEWLHKGGKVDDIGSIAFVSGL